MTAQDWFREIAEELTELHGIGWIECAEDERDSELAYKWTRLAAHFGRLALGETILGQRSDAINYTTIDGGVFKGLDD